MGQKIELGRWLLKQESIPFVGSTDGDINVDLNLCSVEVLDYLYEVVKARYDKLNDSSAIDLTYLDAKVQYKSYS
jgi:hypothetical protein